MSRYSAVAGNSSSVRFPSSKHDFPLYVDPGLPLPQELKYMDMATGTRAHDILGSVIFIDLPTAGDGISFRLSDRVMITRFQIRGLLYGPDRIFLAYWPSVALDMFLIWDRQPNGIVPGAGNLFTTDSMATGTGLFLRPDLRDRMHVLYRQRYLLTCTQRTTGTASQNFGAGNSDQLKLLDLDIPINRTTVFDTTGGSAIANVRQGALYLCFVSSVPVGPTDCYPGSRNQIRLLFADL